MSTFPEDRHLRLVTDDDTGAAAHDGAPVCVTCCAPAALRSAVNGDLLCSGCFRQAHWHPSWSSSFTDPLAEPDTTSGPDSDPDNQS